MASRQELYEAVYENMEKAEGVTVSEEDVWNETLRILNGLARGVIDAQDVEDEYGVNPREIHGYEVERDFTVYKGDVPEEGEEPEEPAFDPRERQDAERYPGQDEIGLGDPDMDEVAEIERRMDREIERQRRR